MATPTRFRVGGRRHTFAGTGSILLYEPPNPGDGVEVRQLTISTLDSAELVVFYGHDDADRLDEANVIRGLFLLASGGAAPDLSCTGAWSPQDGLPIRLWAGSACTVWVSIEGRVGDV